MGAECWQLKSKRADYTMVNEVCHHSSLLCLLFKGMEEAINIKPKNAKMSRTEISCIFNGFSSQPSSDKAEDRKGKKKQKKKTTTLESQLAFCISEWMDYCSLSI